jgi:hypothetical protein
MKNRVKNVIPNCFILSFSRTVKSRLLRLLRRTVLETLPTAGSELEHTIYGSMKYEIADS